MGEVLLELAERVEALTGPDREVDAAITLAIFPWVARDGGGDFIRKDGSPYDGVRVRVLEYTASIDDALTLVPGGANWTLLSHADGSTAEVAHPFVDGWRGVGCEVTAESEPLALCAAALKARAALAQKGGA